VSTSALYLLDTNMVSYLVTGRSAAVRRAYFEHEPHATIAISAVTEAEIRFGLERKPEAIRLRGTFEEFFAAIPVLAWDSDVAKAYGRLRAGINATGRSLALMDLLIAAHAVAAGATLVSHDQGFAQLTPFLAVVDWAKDLYASASSNRSVRSVRSGLFWPI